MWNEFTNIIILSTSSFAFFFMFLNSRLNTAKIFLSLLSIKHDLYRMKHALGQKLRKLCLPLVLSVTMYLWLDKSTQGRRHWSTLCTMPCRPMDMMLAMWLIKTHQSQLRYVDFYKIFCKKGRTLNMMFI